MGTYLNLMLKNKAESNIQKVNRELNKMGFISHCYNNINYGAFVTREQLNEDARYMNEDAEGLKQSPHFKRPITPSFLSSFIWLRIGFHQTKLSGGLSPEEEHNAIILSQWAEENIQEIDMDESKNFQTSVVISYSTKNY